MSTIQSSAEHLTLNADGASKDIKLQSNASEKVIIKSDGKVGIGTSSPSYRLHVETSVDGDFASLIHNTDADNGQGLMIRAGADSGEAILSLRNQASSEKFKVLADGNVGIKTASPQSYHSGADDLVVYASGSSGITIATGDTTSTVALKFADGTDSTSENVGYIDYAHSDNSMRFGTTATERMRIDSSGNLSIGTYANPPSSSFVRLTSSGIVQSGRTGTGNQPMVEFFNGNGVVGSIYTGGTTTTYYTSSDYRLKENVNYDWDATTRLKQLKPARFNFKTDESVTFDGFLAHEVSSIVPEAIGGEKDAMKDEEYEVTPAVEEVRDEEGNITTEAVEAVMGTRSVIDPQGIDQSKLVPLLVKTIQELEARITALEA